MRSAVVLLLLLAACATRPPVSPMLRLPPDTAQECANVCQSIGLRLSAVVVVASSAGCVCEVQPSANALQGGASAASAGAVIVVDEEQRQHQQQQQQKHQQPPYVPPHHH